MMKFVVFAIEGQLGFGFHQSKSTILNIKKKILKWILTFGQLMNEHPLWWNRKWNLLHPRATLTYVSYHLLQMKWFLSEQVIVYSKRWIMTPFGWKMEKLWKSSSLWRLFELEILDFDESRIPNLAQHTTSSNT